MNGRRSIRLKEYDYRQPGAYFVTICTFQKQCLFGEVVNDNMELNEVGKMVLWHWNRLPHYFPNVDLDARITMPNHLHGIIQIIDIDGWAVGAKHSGHDRDEKRQFEAENASPLLQPKGTKPQSLSAIIQNFKSITSRKFNRMQRGADRRLWQRNYYEHIIRNEDDLSQIRQYIIHNPLKWYEDEENPINCRDGSEPRS